MEKQCNSKYRSILVIEDDQDIRVTLQELLELEGYKVFTAENGEVGLQALKRVERPCLILLDLMMPVMNGWEFLAELRTDEKNMLATIPVVIISAAGNAANSAQKQANGFVKKPIDLDALIKTVHGYCH